MTASAEDKLSFLANDFYDALRWLFEGAVAWQAGALKQEISRHQQLFAMSTAVLQARALYEFFFSEQKAPDDARAQQFVAKWAVTKTEPYKNYMASGMPANKRFFHLVFGREFRSGGSGHHGPDHLNQQVLSFAKDISILATSFVNAIDDPDLRTTAQEALDKANQDGAEAAADYEIPNPFL
ncbi:MAG: hypothetical protein ACR2KK_08840 [Acidimicrobiales bacterium]